MINIKHALRATALLLSCSSLIACASDSDTPRRYSAHDCKQMHGRGNISLEELRECRFTGQVQRLESK